MSLMFKSLIVLLVAMTSATAARAVPYELTSCDKNAYNFRDLREYSKAELMDAYCNCKGLEEINKSKSNILLRMAELIAERDMIGVSPYNRYRERSEYDKTMSEAHMNILGIDAARSNASRIKRVLSKTYNMGQEPRCEKNN